MIDPLLTRAQVERATGFKMNRALVDESPLFSMATVRCWRDMLRSGAATPSAGEHGERADG